MTELARHETDYAAVEQEPPEIAARNLATSAYLLASATAFAFLCFVFAYFYLRALNSNGMWRPPHVGPPQAFGAAIMAASVVSALLVRLGLRELRARRRPAWRLRGAGALAFGIAAFGLQLAEYAELGFGPTQGGYASVFVGWTGAYALFVLATMYWLETVVATAFRARRIGGEGFKPGEAAGDAGRGGADISDPISLVLPGLEAISVYWTFLAGIGVVTWVILYLA